MARLYLYIPRAAGRRGAEYPAGAEGGAVCPGCLSPRAWHISSLLGKICLPGAYAGGDACATRGGVPRSVDRPYRRGSAYSVLGFLYSFLGHFPAALAALSEVAAIGRVSGDRRHQSQAAGWNGWISARCGAWQEGLVACQQALEYAPDAFETALNLGILGYVYLEKGEMTQAIPVLESAVQAAQQYRSQQVQSWFKVFLGEAYRMNNQLEQAQDLAMQGFELSRRINHPWGIGCAQGTLGRIAHTSGALAAAETHLQQALATFDAMPGTIRPGTDVLDLACLAHTQENQDAATTHLSTAYAWFKKLQVPHWVERTEQLAREYGVTLSEVALEELTEGEP